MWLPVPKMLEALKAAARAKEIADMEVKRANMFTVDPEEVRKGHPVAQ